MQLRVLYVASSAAVGGGNRSLLTLASGLRQHGGTSWIACPADGRMMEACRQLGFDTVVIEHVQPEWRHPRQWWHGYARWMRVLADTSPDVVHANDVFGARSICLATRRLRLPLVCHVRYPPGTAGIRWAFRFLPKPHVFIFNSRMMEREAGAAFRRACPHSRQRMIYNGVALDEFDARPKEPGRIARIGIVANLAPVKGHMDFLSMARELHDRRVPAEFWVIGEDVIRTGYREVLERRCQELFLEDQVRFLGYREDVPALLDQLDILVCSSHVETFGRCLIEAMACRRPVVATSVGGIPEVVEHQVTGILVPPRAPTQLADAVEGLLKDPTLRQVMGEAGRKRVEQLFTTATHREQVLRLYQDVLHRQKSIGDAPARCGGALDSAADDGIKPS